MAARWGKRHRHNCGKDADESGWLRSADAVGHGQRAHGDRQVLHHQIDQNNWARVRAGVYFPEVMGHGEAILESDSDLSSDDIAIHLTTTYEFTLTVWPLG